VNTDEGVKCFDPLLEQIREQIRSGQFKPGQKIGTESGFVRETGLSRNSVRRGIDLLIEERVAERRPGKGVFVVTENNRARTIQVVVPHFSHSLYHRITQGIQDACRQKGLLMKVQDAHGHVQDDLELIRQLPEISRDGAIIVAAHHPDLPYVLFDLQRQGYPFVVIDKRLRELPAPTVLADNYQGGYLVGQELVRLGHRHIAMVTDFQAGTVRERLNGLRDALNDGGVLFDRSLVIESRPGSSPEEWMEILMQATRTAMEHDPRPTAVFYWCDEAASYGCRALREIGFKIPEDVSVIGFDDYEICEWLTPPLASVHQPLEQMGEAALELLLEWFDRGQKPWEGKDLVLPVALKMRPSVAPVV
jgi:DNA-binding LacI/PurR family transcriptional regulator